MINFANIIVETEAIQSFWKYLQTRVHSNKFLTALVYEFYPIFKKLFIKLHACFCKVVNILITYFVSIIDLLDNSIYNSSSLFLYFTDVFKNFFKNPPKQVWNLFYLTYVTPLIKFLNKHWIYFLMVFAPDGTPGFKVQFDFLVFKYNFKKIFTNINLFKSYLFYFVNFIVYKTLVFLNKFAFFKKYPQLVIKQTIPTKKESQEINFLYFLHQQASKSHVNSLKSLKKFYKVFVGINKFDIFIKVNSKEAGVLDFYNFCCFYKFIFLSPNIFYFYWINDLRKSHAKYFLFRDFSQKNYFRKHVLKLIIPYLIALNINPKLVPNQPFFKKIFKNTPANRFVFFENEGKKILNKLELVRKNKINKIKNAVYTHPIKWSSIFKFLNPMFYNFSFINLEREPIGPVQVNKKFSKFMSYFWPTKTNPLNFYKFNDLCSNDSTTIMFLRKNKIFNKSRYSRNRQLYRTGVYMCLFINVIFVYFYIFSFYRFAFVFSYLWFGIGLFVISMTLGRAMKYRFYDLTNFVSEFEQFFYWTGYLVSNLEDTIKKISKNFYTMTAARFTWTYYYLVIFKFKKRSKKANAHKKTKRAKLFQSYRFYYDINIYKMGYVIKKVPNSFNDFWSSTRPRISKIATKKFFKIKTTLTPTKRINSILNWFLKNWRKMVFFK